MLYLILFFPMAAACIAWFLGIHSAKARDLFASLATVVSFGLSVALLILPDRSADLPFVAGIGIHLLTDGFRKVYLCVITFVWMMTTLLGREYFSHYQNVNRYVFFNLMTLGATVGVFLAADLGTALLFFEIMSFTSYTWVIQEETPAAIKAANTYLAVAVIGGLAALFGLFLLYHTLGTLTISELYAAAQATDHRTLLYVAGSCVLFGFGAKAGMFPLHIWLPKAHPVAPAPASALLSGLLTKSGIFGVIAITCHLFWGDPNWGRLILILGTVTMVLGAVLALFSVDLKRTLACSSVSQIGFILVGVGMMGMLGESNALAARGTLLHMLNHSLFKLVLFLSAGVVYMNTHALNLNDIRGFGKGKPVLLIAFLCGALGIGGFPLFSGYVSKTLLHESIVEGIELFGSFGMHAVEWLFLLSGGITVAYMTKLFVALFCESHPEKQRQFSENRSYMRPLSAAVLLVSAALIPLLGSTASLSMDAIADLGTDYLNAGTLQHAVTYFSLENMKGALISIAIGFALYFGVVRTLLMSGKKGRRIYVDRWPARLDLETLLYRPLLLKWLPGILGPIAALFGENRLLKPLAKGTLRVASVGAHAASDLLDAFVLLLRRTVYRENKPEASDKARASLAYRVGSRIDAIASRCGMNSENRHRYAEASFRAQKTLRETGHRLTGNLSFALFMMVLAISFVLFYMLILH